MTVIRPGLIYLLQLTLVSLFGGNNAASLHLKDLLFQPKFDYSDAVKETKLFGPIPQPSSIQYVDSGAVVKIPRDFTIRFTQSTVVNCDLFHDTVKRFHQIVSHLERTQAPLGNTGVVPLTDFEIHLKNICVDTADNKTWPSETMDESYELTVRSDGSIKLTAIEVWGVIRGLETTAQLLFQSEYGEKYIPCVEVADSPRFIHRGFLLDSSRHFLPLNIIKEHLDAMAMTKMNVLHWHIVDDQAFPYESRAFPDMSLKGSYNPYTQVYSQIDVADVIEYARRLGIRVIPEFDTPGHTQSWGPGVPDLLTQCYSQDRPDGTFGPIDPTKNTTYLFLEKFMSEQSSVFPDNYLHLGGDEVEFGCWKSNPDVTAFMKAMGIEGDYAKLEQYYMNQLIQVIRDSPSIKKNMKLLVWQEVVDNKVNLPKDTLVHVWKDGWPAEMAKVTQLGFTTLLSSCWYLNYIHYGPDWLNSYTCEPLNFAGTDEQKKLVLGGEACMWGEYVDETNMIQYTWPRAAAVAERLWSPKNVTDKSDFSVRLEQQRCRMLRRGIKAQPPNGPNFCD
jgi:hexosaminidase